MRKTHDRLYLDWNRDLQTLGSVTFLYTQPVVEVGRDGHVVCFGAEEAKALGGEADGTERRAFTFPVALALPRRVGYLLHLPGLYGPGCKWTVCLMSR